MLIWLKEQFELWLERREEARKCQTCEVLKEQLYIANNEKQKLLDQIIELTNPKELPQAEQQTFEPIKPRIVPWHVRKQLLEAEAREQARLLRDASNPDIQKSNQELEDELLKIAEENDKRINNG